MASGYGYYIGLDGGGTKSAAVLLRVQEDGSSWERVAYTRVGATNRNSAGNEVAQRHLSEALRSLLEQASLAPHDGALAVLPARNACGVWLFSWRSGACIACIAAQ